MNTVMLRLSLQFFAGENEEEEVVIPYESTDTGARSEKEAFYQENNRLDEGAYREQSGYLGTYDEWASYYGYDPDADYQDTVNSLNYEYQTSMASYGQNAEQLYQMGLSNSGVSDIFQANAFSAYLNSMNEAGQNRINTKNQLKREYGEYRQNFMAGWNQYNAESESLWNAYNKEYDQTLQTNAANGYLAVLEAGIFSGERNEVTALAQGDSAGKVFKDYNKVSNYLKNLNYDDATIEAVWERLDRMDLAGLKTDRENAGYINTQGIYVGTAESESILRAALESMKLTASEIENIVTRHKRDWGASDEGKQTEVDGFVTDYSEHFDPDMDEETFINTVMGVDTSDKKSQAYLNAKAAWDEMENNFTENYKSAYNAAITAGLNSKSTDGAIKYVLELAGVENINDALIAKVRSDLSDTDSMLEEEEQIIIDNTATDIVNTVENNLSDIANKNGGVITFADRVNAIYQITADMQGAESQIATNAREGYRLDNYNDIKGFISGENGYDLADAPTRLEGFLNVDATVWDGMSDDDRRKAIIEEAVNVGTDMIHVDELQELVSNYVDRKTKDILNFDKNNSGETGLADAGGLVTYINGLGISSSAKKTLIKTVAENMGFKLERNSTLAIDQLKWGNDAEATLHFAIADTESYEKDEELINTLNENEIGHMSYCDGKVYYRKPGNGKYLWYECSEDMLYVYGDWHTNTDEERAGIYELLVALLAPEQKSEIEYVGGSALDSNIAGDQLSQKQAYVKR